MRNVSLLIVILFASLQGFSQSIESEIERLVYEKLNQLRLRAGVKTLQYDSARAVGAKGHSHYLAANPDNFSHTQRPGDSLFTGTQPNTRGGGAENIATMALQYSEINDADAIATRILEIFQSSKMHNWNMLRGDRTHIGVGIFIITKPETVKGHPELGTFDVTSVYCTQLF